MIKTLFILNDGPCRTERSYNALQLAGLLAKGEIGVCGTCMDARGIAETDLVEGARRSTLAGLGTWTQWADKLLVF